MSCHGIVKELSKNGKGQENNHPLSLREGFAMAKRACLSALQQFPAHLPALVHQAGHQQEGRHHPGNDPGGDPHHHDDDLKLHRFQRGQSGLFQQHQLDSVGICGGHKLRLSE